VLAADYLQANSENAFVFRLDVEQHLVVYRQRCWQSLQRQPEQWQRQLEQRQQQQLRVVCSLESRPLMGVNAARSLLYVIGYSWHYSVKSNV